jgi:hypothetical protein
MDDDLCQVCGLPLPDNLRWDQSTHPGQCTRIARQEYMHNYKKNYIVRRRYLKRHPGRRRDPMKKLGLDYVIAKLAEIEKENRS